MAGKRHHILPRFLLKGFASQIKDADKIFAWIYQRNSVPAERIIDNISVERHFYGKPGDEGFADDSITDIETGLASLVDELRVVQPGRVENSQIPYLVAHLVARTKSIRQSFREFGELFIRRSREGMCDQNRVRALLMKRPKWLDTELAKHIPGFLDLSDGDRDLVRQELLPHLDTYLTGIWQMWVEASIPAMDKAIQDFPQKLSQAANAALAATPFPPALVRRFEGYGWFIFESELPLILGDSACVFRREDGTFRGLFDNDVMVQNVFLPISGTRFLVGSSSVEQSIVETTILNEAAASCSYDFFVGAQANDGFNALQQRIRETAEIISPSDLTAILDTAMHDLFEEG